MNWARAIVLFLVLGWVHELGHLIAYDLIYWDLTTHGLGAWFGIGLWGEYVNFYQIHAWAEPLVALGGLLILLPFLMLWRRSDILSKGVIGGMILYAGLEVAFR